MPANQGVIGRETLVVSTTAVGFAARPQEGVGVGYAPFGADITVETNPIRYTTDGTPASNAGSGVGRLVAAGASFSLNDRLAVKRFSAIRVGAADAVLQIEYRG